MDSDCPDTSDSAASPQLLRIFRILQLLSGREGLSCSKLAERCGVTRRTVFRDIKALAAAGVPVYLHAASRRYRLRRGGGRGAEAPLPAELTQEEVLTLVGMGERVTESLEMPMLQPLRRALEKLRGQLSPEALAQLAARSEQWSLRLAEGQERKGGQRFYPALEQALREHRVLWCSYEAAESKVGQASGEGNLQSFDYKPYGIFWNKGACYVVGHHGGRDAIRTLRLSRFCTMELTERRFRTPEGFDLRQFLGEAWGVVRGGKKQRVELRFTGLSARLVEEMQWHPSQRMERRHDGSLRFCCQVAGLEEIARWVLSMGGECQVLQPPELIAKVREEARRLLVLYQGEVG